MERKKFSIRERFNSFLYAWSGMKALLRSEHNARIHFFLTVLALILAVVLRIGRWDWMALIIVIAFVWMAELFNTAIEKVMDYLSQERHPQIKLVKDLAAAAVLVAAFAAVVVGLLIFIPKLF